MSRKRNVHGAGFKAKVALSAVKEVHTVSNRRTLFGAEYQSRLIGFQGSEKRGADMLEQSLR